MLILVSVLQHHQLVYFSSGPRLRRHTGGSRQELPNPRGCREVRDSSARLRGLSSRRLCVLRTLPIFCFLLEHWVTVCCFLFPPAVVRVGTQECISYSHTVLKGFFLTCIRKYAKGMCLQQNSHLVFLTETHCECLSLHCQVPLSFNLAPDFLEGLIRASGKL